MPRGGRTVSSSNRDRFDLDGAATKCGKRSTPGVAARSRVWRKLVQRPSPFLFTLMVGFDGAEVKDGPVAPNADIATTSVGSGSRAW